MELRRQKHVIICFQEPVRLTFNGADTLRAADLSEKKKKKLIVPLAIRDCDQAGVGSETNPAQG